MTRANALRVGGWAGLVALAVVVGLLLGAVLITVAFPVLDRSGVIAVAATPEPSPTPTIAPTASPDLVMGGAVIPADAQCAGCHTTGAGAIGLDAIPV
ncbi:MAG TPA: hypothetical protein VK194_10975, partial [Candidatus Deferrimicrobium sp.]|nr:hypothetical protein [Candidatus Deferrimicrobium sp.]